MWVRILTRTEWSRLVCWLTQTPQKKRFSLDLQFILVICPRYITEYLMGTYTQKCSTSKSSFLKIYPYFPNNVNISYCSVHTKRICILYFLLYLCRCFISFRRPTPLFSFALSLDLLLLVV